VRRRSDLHHVGDSRHQADAAALGYGDPLHLIADVSRQWDSIYPAQHGRVMLVRHGPANAVAVVELAKVDGADYWRVVTAERPRADQLGEPLTVRSPPPEAATGRQPPLSRLSTEAGQTERLAQGRNGSPDIATAAPAFKLGPELREAMDLANRAAAGVEAELAAGRLAEADLAGLRAAEAAQKKAEEDAAAAIAAAQCLITRGGA
jgi:hypothetical protein